MTEFYYYIKQKKRACSSCGAYHLEDNPYIYIGENDRCTNFSLFTYNNIPNLKAWKDRWEVPETLIVNDSGRQVSPIDMLTIITLRKFDEQHPDYYRTKRGRFEPGSHGLVRTIVGSMVNFGQGDAQCIRNKDTYDLFKWL